MEPPLLVNPYGGQRREVPLYNLIAPIIECIGYMYISCYSVYYVCISQALLYKRYSPASDVWSYGMLMFEIWSLGEKPFPSLTINEVCIKC